jgi:hypothetical protein
MKKPFSYIGSVNSSAKIVKGEKLNVATYVIYLAPSDLSGHNTCPKASQECIAGCLNSSGRVIMDTKNTIQTARINKTKYFYENRPEFMRQLVREIAREKSKAENAGMTFCVRLNGTSDLSPLIFKYDGKTLLELFPDVVFYDYTKVLNRSRIKDSFANYDLTFSFSGHNWTECEDAIKEGLRVAVVFNIKKGQPLPATFKGFEVIDGDITDYRPADASGVIVGLRFKRIKNKETERAIRNSPFVVSVN